jgi:hypothetical protein
MQDHSSDASTEIKTEAETQGPAQSKRSLPTSIRNPWFDSAHSPAMMPSANLNELLHIVAAQLGPILTYTHVTLNKPREA